MNKDWTNFINQLDNRRENLTFVAEKWEEFENQLNKFEFNLNNFEEKLEHTDLTVNYQQQIGDIKKNIEVSCC